MYTVIFTILFPVAGFVVGTYISLDIIRMLVNMVYPEQGEGNDTNC